MLITNAHMLVENKLNKLQKCAWWHLEVLFLLYTAAQLEGVVFIQFGLVSESMVSCSGVMSTRIQQRAVSNF